MTFVSFEYLALLLATVALFYVLPGRARLVLLLIASYVFYCYWEPWYGYIIGARSSRVIERECVDDVCFRWLAAGAAPDYRAIARFRRRHLAAMGHLFVQALALCQAAGVVRLDRVALDGTRVRANVLAAEVSALLADAERIDKDEDATFGKNRRGGVVSEQPRQRETGLAKIGTGCEGPGIGGEATG